MYQVLLSSLFLNELFCFVNSTSIKTSFLEHGHRPVQSDGWKEHLDIVLNENIKSQEKKIFLTARLHLCKLPKQRSGLLHIHLGTGEKRPHSKLLLYQGGGSWGVSHVLYFHIVSFQ